MAGGFSSTKLPSRQGVSGGHDDWRGSVFRYAERLPYRYDAALRSSLSVCHFAIRWPRASLSGVHFAISCAILLSFVLNVRRIARRIAIAILCAKDVDQ